jgi:hypothetical protein
MAMCDSQVTMLMVYMSVLPTIHSESLLTLLGLQKISIKIIQASYFLNLLLQQSQISAFRTSVAGATTLVTSFVTLGL